MTKFSEGAISQHDGAILHYANIVHKFLGTAFLSSGYAEIHQAIATMIPGSGTFGLFLVGLCDATRVQ